MPMPGIYQQPTQGLASKPKLPSHKGFVAIDLDGTTVEDFSVPVVLKGFFGISKTEATYRDVLIVQITAAWEQGFDIYILTARGADFERIVMQPFSNKIGTVTSDDVKAYLEGEITRRVQDNPPAEPSSENAPAQAHGFKISKTVNTRWALKGRFMAEIFEVNGYDKETAVGILLDDQFKQVQDVRRKNQEKEDVNLLAFDINDPVELNNFQRIIEAEVPQEIQDYYANTNVEISIEKVESLPESLRKLHGENNNTGDPQLKSYINAFILKLAEDYQREPKKVDRLAKGTTSYLQKVRFIKEDPKISNTEKVDRVAKAADEYYALARKINLSTHTKNMSLMIGTVTVVSTFGGIAGGFIGLVVGAFSGPGATVTTAVGAFLGSAISGALVEGLMFRHMVKTPGKHGFFKPKGPNNFHDHYAKEIAGHNKQSQQVVTDISEDHMSFGS